MNYKRIFFLLAQDPFTILMLVKSFNLTNQIQESDVTRAPKANSFLGSVWWDKLSTIIISLLFGVI